MNYRHIEVEPLTPTIGGIISGVDLNNASDDIYDEIRHALFANQVVFFRDQTIDPKAYLRLGEVFGEVERHEFFPHIDGYPQIQTLTHEGSHRPETDRWHADVTFRERPSQVTILHAAHLPKSGGDTLWSSAGAAFEAMGEPLQQLLLSLDASHDFPWSFRLHENYKYFAKEYDTQEALTEALIEHETRMIRQNPTVIHPAVINHPVTERLTLFVNYIWTKRIEGMHPDLSENLLRTVYDWIKKPEFFCRFKWETGSVAIWDNIATQHYATFDYAPQRREMLRMTCGDMTPQLIKAQVPEHLWPTSRG